MSRSVVTAFRCRLVIKRIKQGLLNMELNNLLHARLTISKLAGSGLVISSVTVTGALILALCLALPFPVSASDYYISPAGAGKNDGSSWDNSLAATELARTVNETMLAGDTLFIGGGIYSNAALQVTSGGQPGKPKRLTGMERNSVWPTFSSSWNIDLPDKGGTAIQLASSVSHLQISHIRIRGYRTGISAKRDKEKGRRDLLFEDVDMEQFEYGFYLSHCDGMVLRQCDLKRYAKHGFRFEEGCDRVTVQQCTADCSEGDPAWETKTELFPFGFSLNDGGDPNTGFLFEDCRSVNNMKTNQKNKYLNGDGFVAEGNSSDVSFHRCTSIRNQDGGFDMKPPVSLRDCIAVGNKRGYRIWRLATLENCAGAQSLDASLWVKEAGKVTCTNCTFHDDLKTAVRAEPGATVTLSRCIVSMTGELKGRQPLSGQVTLQEAEVCAPGSDKADPEFSARQGWDGKGAGMDSRKYPGFGYSSTRIQTTSGTVPGGIK